MLDSNMAKFWSIAIVTILLNTASATAECQVSGVTHQEGETFVDADGCNSCTCRNGMAACTLKLCPPKDNACVDNGFSYQPGDTFTASDGCNKCTCTSTGVAACTAMLCPPVTTTLGAPLATCLYNGITYNVGDAFNATDGCNKCVCSHTGVPVCTKMYCAPPGCQYEGRTYNEGDSFDKDCNTCTCSNGRVTCTDISPCPIRVAIGGGKPCVYNGVTYSSGNGGFPSADKCNTCYCNNGHVSCTEMFCATIAPTDQNTCQFNGVTHSKGDTYSAEDGCNHCFCSGNNMSACTEMYCMGAIGRRDLRAVLQSLQRNTFAAVHFLQGYCDYNGTMHAPGGPRFPAMDGCNTCNCYNGHVACTEIGCAGNGADVGGRLCVYNGTWHLSSRTGFPSTDGCNTCTCNDGFVSCTEMGCIDNRAHATPGTCLVNGVSYNTGASFKSPDGCNTCRCSENGFAMCTEMACAQLGRRRRDTSTMECTHKGVKYQAGASFKDKCNKCRCLNGHVACTMKICFDSGDTSTMECTHKGVKYQAGASFKDKCNKCRCLNGHVACTMKICFDS